MKGEFLTLESAEALHREKEIIEHYGLNHQQRKLQEEVFELQEAITRYDKVADDVSYARELIYLRNCIIEELADVHLVLNQIQEYFKIQDEEVLNDYTFKLDRTLKRIGDE